MSVDPEAQALDLIAIGRAGIDLYGEQVGGQLEDMGSFAKYVGGSPTNTAIGAARLGLKSAMITRVGADHFGRFIHDELVREGVDVRAMSFDPERLTGMVVLGIRDLERFPMFFYRRECADMTLVEADIDPAFIAAAKAVLISGTHLSMPGVFAASLKAARAAKAAGRKVVFDVDYRPVLWGVTALDAGENRFVADSSVTARLGAIAGLCDLIVGTEEEFQILGGEAEPMAALRAVRAKTQALLVCKRGPLGATAFPGEIGGGFEAGVSRRGVEIEVFNVLGAGDAFMAGFLRGWLRDEPLETALDYANACGALVVSRHGCSPAMPSWTELAAFMDGGPHPRRLREDAALEHLHWATTRKPDRPELFVLALDDGEDAASVASLLAGVSAAGLLARGSADLPTLYAAAEWPCWLGRRVAADNDLNTWPLPHVVVADGESLVDEALVRLAGACRRTRHELMLEAADAAQMRRAYRLGVRPDWWAIDAGADWPAVAAAIAELDPFCRGVILTGDIRTGIAKASEVEEVKGFIAGGAGFESLLEAWRAARRGAEDRAAAE
jgi:5-dehydro-2-deoxygluconokinase